jgi:hypothetical protein
MNVPNPTEAKELVLHFLAKSGLANPNAGDIARWINMAKHLLQNHTYHTIKKVIDHVFITKKLSIYSFGFIVSAFDKALMEIDAMEQAERVAETMKEIASSQIAPREGVSVDEQSAERNRRKASGLGVQSRLRAQYSFDMYEAERQAD